MAISSGARVSVGAFLYFRSVQCATVLPLSTGNIHSPYGQSPTRCFGTVHAAWVSQSLDSLCAHENPNHFVPPSPSWADGLILLRRLPKWRLAWEMLVVIRRHSPHQTLLLSFTHGKWISPFVSKAVESTGRAQDPRHQFVFPPTASMSTRDRGSRHFSVSERFGN